MPRRNPFAIDIKPIDIWSASKPKTKRQLTYAQKIWCWEHNSHKCYICGKRVSKLSDAEFDHVRAYSKRGATNLSNVKIVHRQCNRLKGTRSLSETKKLLGIKSKTKRKITRKKRPKRKSTNPFEIKIPQFRF